MRNIKLVYILSFLRTSWFWLGIWVYYYLRFTNYAGIGLLETIMVLTFTLTEIPTGAVADLLGKRKTMITAFLLLFLGEFTMGMASSYTMLGSGIFLACIGGTFFSGTMEALVYDSLKEKKQEKIYDKIISNINTIQLISMALASVVGGFLYTLNPSLPFFMVSAFCAIGFFIAFWLKEPLIDSQKFSLNNFVIQTKQGVKQLFKNKKVKKITILLLSVDFFIIISWEMLNDLLAVEFGFQAKVLGIFWAVVSLIAATVSQLTPIIRQKFGEIKSLVTVGIIIGLSFLVSPFVGLIVGGLSILLRYNLQTIFQNLTSVVINKNTESKFRATTISTYNMIKNLPYVLTAYFLGCIMDFYSAKVFAFGMGTMLLAFLFLQTIGKGVVKLDK
jgi:MFS family permease